MITIDAQGKVLGRVASQAAMALMGKNSADFAKNVVVKTEVKIVNASKIVITGDKARDKDYVRYSGYPGGLKKESYAMLTTRRGSGETIRRAVLGMLPKNKLQSVRIKNIPFQIASKSLVTPTSASSSVAGHIGAWLLAQPTLVAPA